MTKLAVVIPAHNEQAMIAKVIKAIPTKIKGVNEVKVFVIDDGSKDQTATLAKRAGATVLSHRVNLGAGGATLTGLAAAKKQGFDLVVTLDGDGQHDPSDIKTLIATHLKYRADLVIGSRFLSQTIRSMPTLKWFGNKIMNAVTYLFSGQLVTDSQSGFRLFSATFLGQLHCFSTGGYEFCSEAIVISREQKLSVMEVPIRTIYFTERRGQNPLNGANIFLRLLYRNLTN